MSCLAALAAQRTISWWQDDAIDASFPLRDVVVELGGSATDRDEVRLVVRAVLINSGILGSDSAAKVVAFINEATDETLQRLAEGRGVAEARAEAEAEA